MAALANPWRRADSRRPTSFLLRSHPELSARERTLNVWRRSQGSWAKKEWTWERKTVLRWYSVFLTSSPSPSASRQDREVSGTGGDKARTSEPEGDLRRQGMIFRERHLLIRFAHARSREPKNLISPSFPRLLAGLASLLGHGHAVNALALESGGEACIV